jgi:hypothetical protein
VAATSSIGRRSWVIVAVILIGSCLALCQPARGAATTATPESYPALLSQIDRGQVRTALLTPKKRIVHARLEQGARYVVKYPPKTEHVLLKRLHARNVNVAFRGVKKHHSSRIRRRYIALGVLGLAALAALGWWFARRRRGPAPGGRPEAA